MLAPSERRGLVCAEEANLSIRQQCELLGIARSSYYYQPGEPDPEDLELTRLIDRQYLKYPFYGSRKMTDYLQSLGHAVNRKRVQRLMRTMGIAAIAPGPSTSQPHPEHRVYPYLLRGVDIQHVNHVWSTDITYIPLGRSFAYLAAVIDWHSRYVLSWEISASMETTFCLKALERSLKIATPRIFNTDQGAQFTSEAFTARLAQAGIAISMDGRGRCHDNIFIERLWRSVKYEDVYIKDYQDIGQLRAGLGTYFRFYNSERAHQSLGYLTPSQVYHDVP